MYQSSIPYPYLPPNRLIKYVPADNIFMIEAKKLADASTCFFIKTGAVIVLNNQIISRGSNTGLVKVNTCPRQERQVATGTHYEFCQEICGQEGHAEITAVKNAEKNRTETTNADLYLYGHWWCCEPCWAAMISAGIKDVYLVEGATELFNNRK